MNFRDEESHTSISTINVGDTIMWVWDSGSHSTTSGACNPGCTADGIWDSGIHGTGFTFSHTFTAAGTFPYHCTPHGSAMQGTVIVQGGGTAPAANFTFSPASPVVDNTVNFTDTSTNTPTSWSWNFGDPASGTNNTSTTQNPTHVFASAASYTVTLQATNAAGSNTATKTVVVSAGDTTPCVVNGQTLCLNGGRFEVRTQYQTSSSSGSGNGVKLTDDSGYFWFFTDTNIEIVVKVLSFCFAPFNSYAVFSAGLTDQGVTLTVRDAQTGAVYSYVSPLTSPTTIYVTQPIAGAFPNSCP